MNQTNKEDRHQTFPTVELLLRDLRAHLLWSIDDTRIVTKLEHS